MTTTAPPGFALVAGTPAPAGLHRYCGYTESGPPVRRRELPTASVTMILSFGDRISITTGGHTGEYRSFVAGPGGSPVDTAHDGSQHGLQVDLDPLAAFRLLGVPPRLLSGAPVAVEDLDARLAGLVGRLGAVDSWAARFALLDDHLGRWMAAGPAVDRPVAWAWRQLEATGGRAAVGDLAEESGWSRRHFTARFHEQVGLTPKAAAQLLRFGRAADLLRAGGDRSIAEVAAEAGYADHSHLVREVRRLAHTTPGALRAPA